MKNMPSWFRISISDSTIALEELIKFPNTNGLSLVKFQENPFVSNFAELKQPGNSPAPFLYSNYSFNK